MTAVEDIALTLLRQEGIDCIWDLHTHAARIYLQGERDAAEWLVKIADFAEDMYRQDCLEVAGLDRSDGFGRLQP